jgi:CDP-diacylglycerol--glycerol-3-phosphate 3-phosphatidyltransferase/cardiolipin synthase
MVKGEGSMDKLDSSKFNTVATIQNRAILYIPSVMTFLRLLVFPLTIFSISIGQIVYADLLFIFAITSDFFDGRVARKLGVSSKFGARLDVIVDFAFIGGMFFYFVEMGFYPLWTLLLIVGMFGQFIVTSWLLKMMYDPFGKYYGSLLYGAVGLTLLLSGQFAHSIILVCLVGVTVVSIASRIYCVVKHVGQRS